MINRFKGLDLIEYLKKYGQRFLALYRRQWSKKTKWLSEEAIPIAEKRREVKSKREKETCTYLNAEFQRIARRDKKAVLSEQCKEREENNNMGKTRYLSKKIRDTKGTLQVKMHAIKTRNDMDLAAAEDIKKRCQEYTEKLCRNVLMTQITMMMWSLT